jgi:uncharacterized protein YcbX
VITLSAINIYPIKSCGGIAASAWEVDAFGLRDDRRWMVATPDGGLVSQRECPELALVRVAVSETHLTLSAPELAGLVLPRTPLGGRPARVKVWSDEITAVLPDHRADEWFSRVSGRECVLAYIPDSVVRPLDPTYAPDGGRTGFADGFPLLLVGEASLRDLNRRLATPLPMNRFRPNLVVAGSEPFAEDDWRRFRVGDIPMAGVKPCARCVVTTTDQATGRRDGEEPLRTLAAFRRHPRGVMFGQNVVHFGTGLLRVGDIVRVGEA